MTGLHALLRNAGGHATAADAAADPPLLGTPPAAHATGQTPVADDRGGAKSACSTIGAPR
ncbi:hypothetical protein P8605_32295 [Streptomyces sp. T-3]|nr:hypothetical protein [Streptomyces sp. T-3]